MTKLKAIPERIWDMVPVPYKDTMRNIDTLMKLTAFFTTQTDVFLEGQSLLIFYFVTSVITIMFMLEYKIMNFFSVVYNICKIYSTNIFAN